MRRALSEFQTLPYVGDEKLWFIERIPAVDGRKLSESELLKWRQRESPFLDWTTHELTPGEIGCFLSHREFWQKVVDERLSHAFVLEDDILLADDCFKILSSADWIPSDADFVKLNLFPTNSTHTYPVSKPVGLVEGREIRRTAGRIYGTGCYVMTEAAARECLEHSGKLSLPVDLFMFDSRFSFATEKKRFIRFCRGLLLMLARLQPLREGATRTDSTPANIC